LSMRTEKIGQILRSYRKEAGLTQKEVADACGRSRTTIAHLEYGRLKDIPISFLLSYLRAVGVSFGSFFSQLDEMELKELLPEEIERRDLPKRTKKKLIKYAIGIKYQKRGIVSFPEYVKIKISRLLSQKSAEGKERYLSFAKEYFEALKKGKRLERVSERYRKLGLNPILLWKIKKIVIRAFRREEKRAERKVIPEEKKREMLKGYLRYQEGQDRIIERVKKLIFNKKGMTQTHLTVYIQCAKSFYRLLNRLRKAKREIPLSLLSKEGEILFSEFNLKEIDEWRERVIREDKIVERGVLNEVIKIVLEEFARIYLNSEEK
jgi:transcriptional regulator with XRE-family HTH domain